MSFALQSEKEVAIPRLQKKRLADPLATAFEIKTHLSSMSVPRLHSIVWHRPLVGCASPS